MNKVLGIRGGYQGFKEDGSAPVAVELTPNLVSDIHHQGGTILSSSRGGFEADAILSYLIKHGISQLYIIGGDGTHRAASLLCQECLNRNLNIAIAGIPKTIDNDIDLIDRSFGFQTSVEAAQNAIKAAKVNKLFLNRNFALIQDPNFINLLGRSEVQLP